MQQIELNRLLGLKPAIKKKSIFLFGPRQTGKTTLIKSTFSSDYQYINLLNASTRLRLLENPSIINDIIKPQAKAVIIDEIQKVPELLDEVHNLIEEKNIKFLLTGSSARKLKRCQANMLGGRARTYSLYPLVSSEIPDFNLERYLTYGGLPSIYLSDDPFEDLLSYVDTYLKEEIEQEAQIRNIGAFARFLKVAALTSSQMLNYSEVGSDCMVNESTVRSYYQVLKDTLTGNILEPWIQSKKRKAIRTPKFYFFDIGITNAILQKSKIERNSDDFGKAFEHFIYMELKAYLSYNKVRMPICYWRSVNGQEVDFIIGDEIAIEVKSKIRATNRDAKNLKAISEEKIFNKYMIISHDPMNRKNNNIEYIFWKDFLHKLWNGEIIDH